MKSYREEDFVKGWFVGNFQPTCIDTDAAEVALKRYEKGSKEPRHHHKIATEITFVVEGMVSMNGEVYRKGDVVVVNPGESVEFIALENSTNVVVKLPCMKGDKYEDNIP